MRFRRLIIFISLLVLAMPVVAQRDTVVFGFIVDDSGGNATAEQQVAGLQIALQMLNDNNGIGGNPVDALIARAGSARAAATTAEALIAEGVDFLLAPTESNMAQAVSAIAAENGVPVALHSPGSSDFATSDWHPYLVQVAPNSEIEGRIVADYLSANVNATMIATIAPDGTFGRDTFSAFELRFSDLNPGADIVTEQWPEIGDSDMTVYLANIQASAPETLYSAIQGEQALNFVRTANDFGLFDELRFIGLMDVDFLQLAGFDLPDGLTGYARAPFYAINNRLMDNFVERYRAETGEFPSDAAILIADGVFALSAAADEAGSTDGDAISAVFDGLSFASLRGNLTIRGCDHLADAGVYVGTTTQDSPFNFPILDDISYVPADEVWDSCDQIEDRRG